MRSIEPWVAGPLHNFVTESSARLTLLMTGSGQVIAQYGFPGALDVMSAAALGAGIMASSQEIAALMGWPPFRVMVHQGRHRGHFLAAFELPRGRCIGLVVFGTETTLGLVQLFFDQMVEELMAVAPRDDAPQQVLAANFETELNASLRALFRR